MAGLTTRMLPANAVGGAITAFAGGPNPQDPSRRYYTANNGQFVDVQGPAWDGDAAMVGSQGFLPICSSGTTTLRNQLSGGGYFKAGVLYLDTTIGLIVVWDGLAWRNPVTAAVA